MSSRPSGHPRPRLAIVASHPVQHFCPLYRSIAADGRVELKVFFASDAGKRTYYDPGFARHMNWGDDITDGFEHEYLCGVASNDIEARRGSRAMSQRLANFAPDVVQVYGYSSRLSRQALVWAKCTHRRSMMVGHSELLSPRTKFARAVKALLLPLLFRLPAGFITIGDENEPYYKDYGVSPKRLRRSPIPIDSGLLDYALAYKGHLRATTRTAWKAATADVVILVVGKSIPRKAHDHVLRAVALIPSALRERTITVFAGGGPNLTGSVPWPRR